jgi:prephenate dehydrogenase/cyclohexadieny/prephenate dehydrogenase
MWRDIFFNNSKNIIKALNLFIKNLNQFKNSIRSKQSSKIIKSMIQAKKVRKKIILLKQDVNLPDFGRN